MTRDSALRCARYSIRARFVYVAREGECLSAAFRSVQLRLQQAQQATVAAPEIHRKNDGKIPRGGEQRLETIASLAVRLRETVRRLSQQCEERRHPVP